MLFLFPPETSWSLLTSFPFEFAPFHNLMQHGHRLALSLAGDGGRQIYDEHDGRCADGLWSADYHRDALVNMQHAAFLEIAFHNMLGWMLLFVFSYLFPFGFNATNAESYHGLYTIACLDGFMEAIS
ncbi:uncharacterized protein ARB_05168 [Trichophyton benhamiae CBS 112371]|uniref:Uncharacterized protein n=1 Tax=Arthroderma benhamiae (strain ATCC MYA-4681 / CBS 112371) TaxID=663331 RepID=D4ALH1_ARTBC|nr:uncharacterized protein ARB_05168 [Trichophyton benhamiae CBS 112371]EFE36230.1 hypothetical protein ARB_05168 [Trichophyton benhamiae CBS 112371]